MHEKTLRDFIDQLYSTEETLTLVTIRINGYMISSCSSDNITKKELLDEIATTEFMLHDDIRSRTIKQVTYSEPGHIDIELF